MRSKIGHAKKKRGRPPMPVKEKRKMQSFKLHPAALKAIKQAAKKDGSQSRAIELRFGIDLKPGTKFALKKPLTA
jgi:hypothetical protein